MSFAAALLFVAALAVISGAITGVRVRELGVLAALAVLIAAVPLAILYTIR